jgi:hypothetical protein
VTDYRPRDVEEWRPVAEAEGFYEVSSLGRVRSLSRVTCYGRRLTGRVLKNMVNTHGYLNVALRVDGTRRIREVHRLVAIAFLPPVEGKSHVNHLSGIKTDARAANLEWCTPSENQRHSSEVLGNKRGGPRQALIAYRDGEEIRFESWMDAARKGFNTGSIHAVLNARHGRKTHGGYAWRIAHAV